MQTKDPRRILLVPIEAQNRFERAADVNQRLTSTIEAEKVVFEELAEQVLLVTEDGSKRLKELEDQIAAVDKQIANSQAVLLSNLSQNTSQASSEETGAIMKLIITKVQKTLDTLAIASAKQGSLSVPFMTVVDIEDQLSKIIEDLHDRGLYPEQPSESDARMKATEEHMSKVLAFVKAFLAAHKQATASE